jgi:hypothetical protein
MRLNYIPTELSCTVVRVKILTEMETKNNKEGIMEKGLAGRGKEV